MIPSLLEVTLAPRGTFKRLFVSHTATHTLPVTATHYKSLQHARYIYGADRIIYYYSLTTTHCNSLQLTATQCDTLGTFMEQIISHTTQTANPGQHNL